MTDLFRSRPDRRRSSRPRRHGFALCITLLAAAVSRPCPGGSLERFEFSQPHMGVPFRLVLYATNEVHARGASEAAFKRIAQLNAILSDYDPDSEVSRLCHESGPGQAAKVSPELWF